MYVWGDTNQQLIERIRIIDIYNTLYNPLEMALWIYSGHFSVPTGVFPFFCLQPSDK